MRARIDAVNVSDAVQAACAVRAPRLSRQPPCSIPRHFEAGACSRHSILSNLSTPMRPEQLPGRAQPEQGRRGLKRGRAGDAVLFASTLWHASEPNTSTAERRAFYAQYSRGPLGGARPLALAVRTDPGPLPSDATPLPPSQLAGRLAARLAAHDPGAGRGWMQVTRDAEGE